MAGPKRSKRRTLLMIGTRKGAFFFHGDPARRAWRLDGPHMRIYIGTEPAASLGERLPEGAKVHILQALSGGAV